MPRYANSGKAVDAWYEQWNQGSSTFDLCRSCGKQYDEQPLPAGLEPYQAHEPRGELWEMESPLWEVQDFDGYRCNLCAVKLTPRNYCTEVFWEQNDLNSCTECSEPNDDGEGWDGLCGNCADKTT